MEICNALYSVLSAPTNNLPENFTAISLSLLLYTIHNKSINMSAAAAAPKVKKATKPKVAAAHPPFANMVVAAIKGLKERNGSSRVAIYKYICANYKVDAVKAQAPCRRALKKLSEAKKVVAGGAAGKKGSGCFKLAVKEEKKPKAAKKPKAKKPAAKKAAKKPAAKKAAKKPAAKKAAKKPAAKKPAAKKPAAKKPAAKKAAKKPAAKKA